MWPTAELHVHIEGTLEVQLLMSLADRHGIDLGSNDEATLQAKYRFASLQDFLDIYYENLRVLVTEQDFYDLAYAYLSRAARANVRRTEIFFDPQSHTERGIPIGTVVQGLSRAISDARESLGIDGAMILCFLRHLGGEAALKTLREALPYREHFIGVGLDSSERGFPPSLFAETFALARENGLHCVAHAGEEGGADYVIEAIDILRVERIDHGNRALEDEQLVSRLRETRMPLTVCPLSNIALRTAPPSLSDHPLRRMLDEELVVSVHSDDPAYFGGYIDDNVEAMRNAGIVTEAELGDLAVNSVMSAFIDDIHRRKLLDEIADYATAHGLAIPSGAHVPS